MNLSEIKSIVDVINGFNTPLLALITWLVWRLYSNHLPHFQRSLDDINSRLARLEGRQDERDHDATRRTGKV